MSENQPLPVMYDDAAVDRLRAFVEDLTGGTITRMERQIRWRPAWFADVAVDGRSVALYLRGDRPGDVAIFPDLKREADIITLLHEGDVPVPGILGFCADPPCIVMEAMRGSRDVFAATTSEDERKSVARAVMNGLAAMHRLPIAPFADLGLEVPQSAKDIALVGLRAYLPLYRRTKSVSEPLLEFVIRWAERNYPTHRSSPSFVQFDSGQFLVEDGVMTGFYDFEFSVLSDPYADLATLAMRDPVEPMGRPLPEVFRYYEEATGETLEEDVLQFYVAMFSTLGTMQFSGTVGRPNPGDPHSIYLSWDLSLRKNILLALSKLMKVALPKPEPLPEPRTRFPALVQALTDTIGRIKGADEEQEELKSQSLNMLDWLDHENRFGDYLRESSLADINGYLNSSATDPELAMAALEEHVLQAPPEEDEALFLLLARLELRRLSVFSGSALGREATSVMPIELR